MLIKAFGTAERYVRLVATHALKKIGAVAVKAVAVLIEGLADPDGEIRRLAAARWRASAQELARPSPPSSDCWPTQTRTSAGWRVTRSGPSGPRRRRRFRLWSRRWSASCKGVIVPVGARPIPGGSCTPGSSRSRSGGNERSRAFGVTGLHWQFSESAGHNASERRAGPENLSRGSRPTSTMGKAAVDEAARNWVSSVPPG